jgi:hypothetical protein
MKAQIKILTAPISTNAAYYRNRKLTEKAREWRAEFLNQLQNDYNQAQMKRVREYFDKNKHALTFHFLWLQPHERYFTKKGYISRFSMDVDNCLKIPTDLICGARYTSKWLQERSKYEIKHYKVDSLINLGIDDTFIKKTTSEKDPSLGDTYIMLCDIEVISKPIPY